MKKEVLFFATKSGATKEVCDLISKELKIELFDIKELSKEELSKKISSFDKVIFATSSYGFGELSDEWESKIAALSEVNFKDKTVALVGVGNQERHGDSFCSAMVDFLPKIKGASLVGQTEADGYKFKLSSAFINGKFIGLCVDFKGDTKWQERVKNWCKNLKNNF